MVKGRLKLFISYSRVDAESLAKKIYNDLDKNIHEILIDVNDLRHWDVWSTSLEDNISKCDLVIIVITRAALNSQHVEREILQCQRENKRVILCFHKDIKNNNRNLGIVKDQAVIFYDKYDLTLKLYKTLRNILTFQNSNNIKSEQTSQSSDALDANEEQDIKFLELNETPSKYAVDAIKLDARGSHFCAILYYQLAINALIQLVNTYPEYRLNKIYVERVCAYKNRINALRDAIRILDTNK